MEALLKVKNLKKYFPIEKAWLHPKDSYVKALDNVSFTIYKGETLGLVGESGCGKSTLGRVMVNLMRPTAGEIYFEGRDMGKLNKKEQRLLRKDIQIVFQDPYASLNPRMTIGDIIAEPMKVNKIAKGAELDKKVSYLLQCVGLASYHRNRYPHQFSGGQRQRVGIARALALNPKLIVCDEPVSALDVSIQAQVLNLLYDLQKEFSLTYLFIAHGLNVVKHISTRVGVMYLGKLVEIADVDDLYDKPAHPYAQALLSSIPTPNPSRRRERILLAGEVPSPVNPPSGCRFHPRCTRCMEVCKQKEPDMIEVGPGHAVACHLYSTNL